MAKYKSLKFNNEAKTYQRPKYFISWKTHKTIAIVEVVEMKSHWIDWWSVSGLFCSRNELVSQGNSRKYGQTLERKEKAN